MKLNPLSFGYAGAIVGAATMLLLSVGNGMGMYQNAMAQMMRWHMFYGPTFGGTLTGMIEAAILSFVAGYLFASLYNAFTK